MTIAMVVTSVECNGDAINKVSNLKVIVFSTAVLIGDTVIERK